MGFRSGSHRGNGFAMFVSPSGLGGEFSWTNSCCAVSGSGLHFSYGCDGFCLCGGCSARGYYGYEGYRIGCSGGSCGCSWYDDDDRHGEDDPEDPEPTPSISVGFDDDAVIYEDAYTNAPGNVVPWQSTTTKLHLEVHGGMKGGTAEFTFTNQEKLLGPDIPESINVPAGHCKKYEFTYRGQLPSGSTNDIVVTGTFTENDPEGEGGAATYTDEDSTTSVKVELTPEDLPPMNPFHSWAFTWRRSLSRRQKLMILRRMIISRSFLGFCLLHTMGQAEMMLVQEDGVRFIIEAGAIIGRVIRRECLIPARHCQMLSRIHGQSV